MILCIYYRSLLCFFRGLIDTYDNHNLMLSKREFLAFICIIKLFSLFLYLDSRYLALGNVSIGVAKPYPVSEDFEEEAGSYVALDVQDEQDNSETSENLKKQGKTNIL